MRFPRKVYLIQHKTTGRIYIGSSNNPERRYLTHMYQLKAGLHPVEDMQKDFNEYGFNFTFTLIDEISDQSEASKEYQWMKFFKSYDRGIGYNYMDKATKLFQEEDKKEKEANSIKYEIYSLLQKTNDSWLLDFILQMLQKSQ